MADGGVILGIALTHNTTACLLVDGKLVACASEERFNRKKNTRDFPVAAARYVMEEAGVKPGDVDCVSFGGENPIAGLVHNPTAGTPVVRALDGARRLANALSESVPATGDLYRRARGQMVRVVHPYYQERFCQDAARQLRIERRKIRLNDHHSAHAYAGYAIYAGSHAPEEPALVLTLDAEGDDTCATVGVARNGTITRLATTPSGKALGVLYAAVTQWLGMKADEHEYKVMGLAPYAPASMARDAEAILSQLVRVDGLVFETAGNSWGFLDRLWTLLRGQRFDAVAGGVQLLVERLVTEWVRNAVTATGLSEIILSGGVFMNVKANEVIMEMPECTGLTVCPSAGDESVPIGAVFSEYLRRSGGRWDAPVVDNLYLGPAFSDADVAAALAAHRPRQPYDVIPLPAGEEAETIAGLLAAGEIVARCAGRMEFGARALGNRSILADPSRRDLVRVINDQIKGRDFWMPFACTVLEPGSERYLVNDKGVDAPYMALAFPTRPETRDRIAAGIHPYDHSIRPQVLRREHNPRYFDIVSAFERRTGTGAVLNTSFNLHGEPIVCSPVDALHVFDESGLQNLQLEHVLLRKRR